VLHPEYDAYERRPRRRHPYLAAGSVGLAVAAFVGLTYVGVTAGLGGVLSPKAAPSLPDTSAVSPTPDRSTAAVPVTEPRPARSAPPSRRPAAVPAAPLAAPSCLCPVPPVPTPEASSVSPSHSPSPSPSPSVSPSPSPGPSGTGAGQP
jgi:hypothetical protein